MNNVIERIDKEEVSNIPFSKKDVLTHPDDIKTRLDNLHRSQTLGNLLQTKVKITFLSTDGKIYEVHTTVWAVGAEFVVLKGGITIPIRSISRVE
ncbi:MAG: hypothetical protein HWE15_00740 [Algoriphagus sp.]|uniref:hypothetical protein n=1 Tax=Algoriphagus sp. TaxID=1872435 RepID=UPI0017AB04E3|nr:hypothetical protein [Algoriphagus sp.]NVJ84799.1 hypothetical protein [Algoriphagus sp.]